MALLNLRNRSATAEVKEPEVKEDVWLHSICDMCFAECPTLVHRVDGVVVKVEGDPNGPFGNGRLFRAVGDRPLPSWAAEIDASSWGQVFLKYVISHPAATIAIPGTSKPHHAVDNMTAASGRLPGAELRHEMEKTMDRLL
ncbi:MAG: aldo/keto reductase [Proteobacteria bacterium]|nr:aldo/keto reductase [Pseudomonadota bacterium]